MRLLLASVVLLTGCSGRNLGFEACHDLGESDCKLRSDCKEATCTGCGGVVGFAGCYDPLTEAGAFCPAFTCEVPCSAITDQASCTSRSDCRADLCSLCSGPSTFAGCSAVGDPPVECPAGACPLVPCDQITDSADACDARPDCHAVFVDHPCGCASAGCCTTFSRCADGKANCAGPALCNIAPPACAGPYVVSYASSCYEGCVLKTECL